MNSIKYIENLIEYSYEYDFIYFNKIIKKYQISKLLIYLKEIVCLSNFRNNLFWNNKITIRRNIFRLNKELNNLYYYLNKIWIYYIKFEKKLCFCFRKSPEKYIKKYEKKIKNYCLIINHFCIKTLDYYKLQ